VNAGSLRSIGGLETLAPLTAEEERRLYPVIVRGREAAQVLTAPDGVDGASRRRLQRRRLAGQEAESQLLRSTLGLVRRRVQERGYRFGNEELEAAGLEGLVNALQRFDPERGARFSTYANYWIMKLVNQAVQQQAGLTDSEMRLVLGLRKLERSAPIKEHTAPEVARALGISESRANEVIQMRKGLWSRRFESSHFDSDTEIREPLETNDAPPWVIDALKRTCGDDFDAFWQYTFRTMPLEDIARAEGISRQAMSKRIDRARRKVRESPEAARLQEWFDQQ
jgi:RNA polymerase sigma factor (sigma-70 family)